ncbi:MAG: porin family protein [Prevotellaceae bacterium]|jgi:opacity protein-like surface antigen|nr:porin family protein [Prevotellaceae bacterium]
MEFLIKKALPYVVIIVSSLTLNAQDDCPYQESHDVGLTGGATFYMGDLGDNYSFFRNLSYYMGIVYRYNFNEYYALRGQFAYGELGGDRTRSDLPLTNRGVSWRFLRPLLLAEATAEIGLLPLDVVRLQKNNRISPYLLGGVGFAAVTADKILSTGFENDEISTSGYLQVGVGVKWAVWKRITVGAEWSMRKTFTDKIDYVISPPGSILINNDWIGTLGIVLTCRLSEDRLCPSYQRRWPSTRPLKGRLNQ